MAHELVNTIILFLFLLLFKKHRTDPGFVLCEYVYVGGP